MNTGPTIESIHERLKRAQKETRVVLDVEDRPSIVEMDGTSPPESCWEGRRAMDRFMDCGAWQTTGPGFQQLREWVEVHWNTEDTKPAPAYAVAAREYWRPHGEEQLHPATATRKLISAAKLYGLEQVGKCAAEFAAHGMIEVRRIYLLKGPPLEEAKPLDEHCTLLPYGEALRRIGEETDRTDFSIKWPESDSESVCALEGKYFERANLVETELGQYTSPLLKEGPDRLALLLGLVWGSGFRVFSSWQGVPAVAMATLPYRYATFRSSAGLQGVALTLKGYGPPPHRRPLAVLELHDLATKYSELPEQTRNRLARAMAHIRNSAERVDDEDKAIAVGVALNILFTEDGEQEDPAMLVPRRAAWHYADSVNEKRETKHILDEFFCHHSRVVRGRAFRGTSPDSQTRSAELLTKADTVMRACLKTMIAEGMPKDWIEAVDRPALRLDPPRAEYEIPSVKSDSLSWSVGEQREIDRALESLWRPIVEEAPLPPSGVGPLIATGDLSELAEGYREQRIPYVIPHPARLYTAHPKWPKTASEPFDDRARYYCKRDVERHLELWKDAAASKGLVLFEVPNNADLYHPKCRDEWPQPLLSSHEESSTTSIPNHGTLFEGIATSQRSTPAQHAEPDIHSSESNPTDPPSQLPESVQSKLETEWFRLWTAFRQDVNVETDSLLHVLEAIHSMHMAELHRLTQAIASSDGALKKLDDSVRAAGDNRVHPMYPRLRGFPLLTGEPLLTRSAPDGTMEETAFKGWVAEVYDLWESRYRTQLQHNTRQLPGSIRPRQQVLGDLRHIRNNLLHNGIARRGEAGNCEALRWFSVGERVQVRLRHVIDFLNQMGWLQQNSLTFVAEQGKTSAWHIDKSGEVEEPTPALISARPFVDPLEPDSRFRYAASIAFENLVFGTFPMGPENGETEAQAKDRTDKWMRMTVDEQGNLHIPDLGTVPAAELYWNCLKGETQQRSGVWSPPVQFRE